MAFPAPPAWLISIRLWILISYVGIGILAVGLYHEYTTRLDATNTYVRASICQLAQGSFVQRGQILDKLVLATIRDVESAPTIRPGDIRYVEALMAIHANVQAQISFAKNLCP